MEHMLLIITRKVSSRNEKIQNKPEINRPFFFIYLKIQKLFYEFAEVYESVLKLPSYHFFKCCESKN
jgi:hypothetical protein